MKHYKIGLAVSCFYPKYAALLEEGAKQVLKKHKIITEYAPGCAELPFVIHWLFQKKKCQAVLALGVVIEGQSHHFSSVCRIVEAGILSAQTQYFKPCLHGVIMAKNRNQVLQRLSRTKHAGKNGGQSLSRAASKLYRQLPSFKL